MILKEILRDVKLLNYDEDIEDILCECENKYDVMAYVSDSNKEKNFVIKGIYEDKWFKLIYYYESNKVDVFYSSKHHEFDLNKDLEWFFNVFDSLELKNDVDEDI